MLNKNNKLLFSRAACTSILNNLLVEILIAKGEKQLWVSIFIWECSDSGNSKPILQKFE